MKKNLSELYKEWRQASEEMLEDGYTGSLDCGELKVREDFSRFAELSEVISFEEMLELEKSFEEEGNRRYTGRIKPVIMANGKPYQGKESLIEFSR